MAHVHSLLESHNITDKLPKYRIFFGFKALETDFDFCEQSKHRCVSLNLPESSLVVLCKRALPVRLLAPATATASLRGGIRSCRFASASFLMDSVL